MSLIKSSMFAAAALVAALSASGTVSTADAKHFRSHSRLVILQALPDRHYWVPRYVAFPYKPGCHWNPRAQAFGFWKHGFFIPCNW